MSWKGSTRREWEEQNQKALTFIFDDLSDFVRLTAVIHRLHILRCQNWTVPWDTVAASANIHCTLKGIALPAEEVVRVLPETSSNMT